MALSDLILKKGQIILQQVALEGAPLLDNSPFLNGLISQTSALSDMYRDGDYVVFDAGTSTKFTYEDEFYYLINESDIYLTQPAPAP